MEISTSKGVCFLLVALLACGPLGGVACAPSEPGPATSALATGEAGATCEPMVLLRDIHPGPGSAPSPRFLTPFNGELFLSAYESTHGNEPWRTDGTPAGTVLLKDLHPGPGISNPYGFTVVGGSLFFVAFEPSTGNELWKSDGTEAGTVLVKDLRPGSLDGDYSHLTRVGGTLFFTAWDGTGGRELWKSDGTGAGTVLVKDLSPSPVHDGPTLLTPVGNTLYFSFHDEVTGTELWKSDGTGAGTVLVKDIAPGLSYWERFPLAAVGETLFFSANDDRFGFELWKTDGTEAGTVLVKDIAPGEASSHPSLGRGVGETVFFVADTGTHGAELWKTDGTEAGTVLVTDLRPGPEGSRPSSLTELGGELFFVAWSGPQGAELWKTDGTEAGTVRVMRLDSSAPVSRFYELYTANGLLFFTASDEAHGIELWRSDGTAEGTMLVHDIHPGPGTSSPHGFIHMGGRLFAVASHPDSGTELWASSPCPVSLLCPPAVLAEAMSESGTAVSLPAATVGGDPLVKPPGVVYSPPSGSTFPQGVTTVTVTATWGPGEVRSCTFDVTVRDTTAPSVRCPGDQEAEATEPGGARVDYPEATASDAVSRPVVTYDFPSGSTFPLGTTMVTATATDAAGNSATCTFRVTVRDTTAPHFRCPENQTVIATSGSGAVVSLPPAEVSDAVSTPVVTYTPNSGSFFRMGTTQVQGTATDAAGNVASCVFEVTVEPAPKRGWWPWGCGGGCSVASRGGSGEWWLLLLCGLLFRSLRNATPRTP